MTRGLCRHRTAAARAKGPKHPILVWRLPVSQKCERDVKNAEPVAAVAFCRRAASVARARGKRERRTRSKTRNYLFKGFYPFCAVFLRATGPRISLIVLKDRAALFLDSHASTEEEPHLHFTAVTQMSVINWDDTCV